MENGLSTNTGFKRLESLVALALAKAARALGLAVTGLSFRLVLTSVAAYTYSHGTITANANGSIGGQDGATVPQPGDQVLLPTGIAATASDAGVYTVIQNGTLAGTPFILKRIDLLPDGAVVPTSWQARAGGEGTQFKWTTWQSFAAFKTITIGTTDPKLFPVMFSGRQALVGGTFTLGAGGVGFCPIFDNNTQIVLERVVANTSAATIMYAPTAAGADGRTLGGVGVGAVVVQACIAAGTINVNDISTLNWTVINMS